MDHICVRACRNAPTPATCGTCGVGEPAFVLLQNELPPYDVCLTLPCLTTCCLTNKNKHMWPVSGVCVRVRRASRSLTHGLSGNSRFLTAQTRRHRDVGELVEDLRGPQDSSPTHNFRISPGRREQIKTLADTGQPGGMNRVGWREAFGCWTFFHSMGPR